MTRAEQRAAEKLYTQLKFGLETYFKENGFKQAVLGLSGGIDSSLTLKIAIDALGADNVTAILLPENGISKQENVAQSKMLCKFFNVNYHMQSINQILLSFSTLPWKQNKTAYINTKARLRGLIIYNYANTHDALVLGTTNKSELLLGYGTKYGDLAADLYVLADLYKTEVYKIGEFIGLPDEILKKKPSAELYDGQTDEAELGGEYKDIDNILQQMELGEEELIGKGMNSALVRNVFKLHRKNLHKTKMPYIIPIARDEETSLSEVEKTITEAPKKPEIAQETKLPEAKGIEPIPNEIPSNVTIPNHTVEEAAAIAGKAPQENGAQEVTLDAPTQPNHSLDEETTSKESK